MTSRVQASTRANASHQAFQDSPTMQKFVIGKIDAGIAVLISDSVHLIEFPSLLLPAGVGPGSIVNIACTRNLAAEKQHARDFWGLQDSIAAEFGAREPTPPRLRVRNTTQTSVTLEWDPLDLAAADLVNLSIYRNGQRLTTIPNPKTNTSTKLSGLQLDTDYAFHLVLKTSAGTYTSPVVKTRTHTIDNTTGISVCFGLVEPQKLADAAHHAVQELGAKADDRIQIDTTHFVATSSATKANPNGAPGPEYQKAIQLSIPVVTPEWLLACAQAKKLVPISAYYLGQTNRAASLSSAQLVNPASTTPPANNNRTESLARVTEEREEAPARPPVELEENVEAPPSDQTAATAPALPLPASTNPGVKEQPEPESSEVEPNPTEPVTVETSGPDVAAAEEDAEEADNDNDNSSTRGVKSSNDSSEDRTGQEESEPVKKDGEEKEHAQTEEVSPAAPAPTEGEAEAEEKPSAPSPPPTISVTPPPPNDAAADAPVPVPAPAPEGDLVEVDSEEVGEGREDQVEGEAEELQSTETAKEEERAEEEGAGAEGATAQEDEEEEKEEEQEREETTATAAETSLVDVKL